MKMVNPLLCDAETGVCAMPGSAPENGGQVPVHSSGVVKVLYFTDPICSSCWGIEPQLRKLKLAYGSAIEIEYRMGGLLPDWSYNSGGISKPADVARHWDEVSRYYDMPIDGDIWLEDPLHSSYPPSIAFKAAQMQNVQKAVNFLRELREMVFLRKKNIARWEHIKAAAERSGLDAQQMQMDMDGDARRSFEEDLALARSMGVRGFPTMIFTDGNGEREVVYGSRPFPVYVSALTSINGQIKAQDHPQDATSLFSIYPTLTTREFAELSGNMNAGQDLDALYERGFIEKLETKNGALWLKISS